VRDWITRNLGPVGRVEEVGRGLRTVAGVISDLPEMAQRVERLLVKVEGLVDRGVPLEPGTIGGIARHTTSALRWVAWAAWLILAMLVFGALVAGK
jgi:ubiquinone biosynthesis protein